MSGKWVTGKLDIGNHKRKDRFLLLLCGGKVLFDTEVQKLLPEFEGVVVEVVCKRGGFLAWN